MRTVTVAAIQMACTRDPKENLGTAERLIRVAHAAGAQIILLPELFERQYFCQERRYEYYAYAKPAAENEAVQHLSKLAHELQVVLPVSFYERDGNVLYNSCAVLDADGALLGVSARPTSRTIISTRRNSTSPPATRALQSLTRAMHASTSASAGTSGSRRRHAPWRWPARSSCSTPLPSAPSRSWRRIPCRTGSAPCRDMPPPTSSR